MSLFKLRRGRSSPRSKTISLAPYHESIEKYPRSTWETSITTSTPGSPIQPVLDIFVPLYGLIFPSPPEEARIQAQLQDQPITYDHVINGTLQVTLPIGSGPLRCRSILIAFRSIADLDMGVGRMHEQDLLFERKMQLVAELDQGIILEGEQQYVFFTIHTLLAFSSFG